MERTTKGELIDELERLLQQAQTELPERDSRIRSRLLALPAWFRGLGDDAGIAALEARLEVSIPRSLKLFYRYPAIGCWLLEYHDTDVFLEAYPWEARPHLVRWSDRPHLVLAEFPHSQTICAVELDVDNPRILWGDDGAKFPFDFQPVFFTEWLAGSARMSCQRPLA